MNRREFQFSEGSSNKFWSIELKELSFIVHYGRVGTHGQSQEKVFANADAAKKEHDKLIAEKTKKGYVEVNVGEVSKSRPVPVVKKDTETAAPASKPEPVSPPAPPTAEPYTEPSAPQVLADTTIKREFKLEPLDRYVVTWLDHEPLPRHLPALPSLLQRLSSWESKTTAQGYATPDYASAIRKDYLPHLTAEEKSALREKLRPGIVPMVPPDFYNGWPPTYYIAAAIGMPHELARVVEGLPSGHYKADSQGFFHDYYHRPQWLVFGLGDRASVIREFKRLGIALRNEEQARAWLALTEHEGLDVLGESVCREANKERAAEIAKVLLLVSAPEAALAALQIATQSKAPRTGLQWMAEHPLEAAVGLVPVAMGGGRLAEAAREQLQTLQRSGQTQVLQQAKSHLTENQSSWLNEQVIQSKEETVPEILSEELPPELLTALRSAKISKASAWVNVFSLPSIKLAGKKLSQADIERVLSALRDSPLVTDTAIILPLPPPQPAPLISLLKQHADPSSLDAFAWKLFDQWLSMGAASKDKWALGALGHLGGDASVLKLTPLVRDWPGESQHQRAVFGLEVLRAIGTDTALMSLNGIAQKLKFQGLKEKAKVMMEGIAQARGLSREQLADRIVPDCGLDEHGSRVFDFGPRQFKFVLGPEMKPLVRDAAGKLKPNLPDPGKTDDSEKAEAAVNDWKLLKKTLKEVLKIQAERLEDAMITGRRWSPAEFEQLIIKHPLMVNLARQLVFGSYTENGALTQSFRITEDQSLADANDDSCDLPSTGSIGVVHPAHLDEAAKSAWGQVLSDYEIIPPFQQLGREICRAEPEDLGQTQITRFKGPKIPGIVVYGMLERSQWLKDKPADAGGFMQHSKHFPAANVTAFIQYTGMGIGYYEEPQEIESVYFVPGHVKPDWWGHHENKMKIQDVDPVVVSEVLRMASALVAKAE
jgi:predicted DNA-binding WGR domain protein